MPEIMTRPRPRPAARVRTDAERHLGDYLLRIVREQDARIPAERRAPRTLADMQARMADDACGLCGFWICRCGEQASPPPATAVAPVTGSGGWQCDTCGNWFGVTGAGPASVTAWTCAACASIGR
ncbi:hypothetical protein ACIPJS_38305 [Streptomyces sp. NPDC086783]|uniref:hypothetical protein n=1 Tax=Streptomyces sp. NPDC086783 TaxID=3365758 RepID=UPI00381F7032